jgi:hypothetical protein
MLGGVYAVLAATGQRLTRKNANATANTTAKNALTSWKKTKSHSTASKRKQHENSNRPSGKRDPHAAS